MTNGRLLRRACAFTLSALCAGTVFVTVSCSSNESKVKKMLETSLKPVGVTAVVVDFFYKDPNSPDKAYASATLTYNFATAEGKPQREFLGFILAREGDGWRIEKNTNYTKDQQQAVKYLSGGK